MPKWERAENPAAGSGFLRRHPLQAWLRSSTTSSRYFWQMVERKKGGQERILPASTLLRILGGLMPRSARPATGRGTTGTAMATRAAARAQAERLQCGVFRLLRRGQNLIE